MTTKLNGRQILENSIPSNRVIQDWDYYATKTKYTGTITTITGGKVYTGAVNGIPVYRFISTAFTGQYPTTDAFYSGFDGTTLSNNLATR